MRVLVKCWGVCFVGLALVSCKPRVSESEAKIVDGETVNQKAYPYVRRLVHVSKGRKDVCTASFISKSVLITAGHCVKGKSEKHMWIEFGGFDLEIEKYTVNKSSTLTFQVDPDESFYDVALVKLKEDVEVNPIHFSPRGVGLGNWVKILGFGQDAEEIRNDTDSKTLRRGYHKIKIRPELKIHLKREKAAAKGALAADGDSGGPMIIVEGKDHSIVVGLVGIFSMHDLSRKNPYVGNNYFAHLRSPKNKAFFKRAALEGYGSQCKGAKDKTKIFCP